MMKMIFRLMLLCVLLSGCVRGYSPSSINLANMDKWVVSEPLLRIETNAHNSEISRISVDAAEKMLVTCSKDKSVRVWNMGTGELIKVIRVPIGEGKFGGLFAAALSPDGKTIAAGGYDHRVGIFIIDLASGEIRRRVRHSDISYCGSIFHLAFSKDGRYLAAGMYRKGLIVFSTDTWHRVVYHGRSDGYTTNWVDFAPDGRLVTASHDGFIRVFDSNFKPIIIRKVLPGQKLQCVAFSPDGRKIAAAFRRSDKIQVLSASDLSLLYEPATFGVPNGNPTTVAWSSDGQRLMASGRWWYRNGDTPIRIWKNGGQGEHSGLIASSNTVNQLIGLKNGGVVYGTFDSVWGTFDRNGNQVLKIMPQTIDYHWGYKELRISKDGLMVSGISKRDNNLLIFDVADRVLKKQPLSEILAGMKPSITEDTNHAFTNWKYHTEPTLNGNKIELKKREQSICLSIAPDGERFVLGTGWYLRCYTRTQTGVLKKWMSPVNGSVYLERETTAKDVAMIFLAGHGVNDRSGHYYFLPAEGTPESLKRTGIPYHEIRNTISGLPGKVLAFIDTCHAGGIMGERLRGIAGDIDRIANDLASAENGVVVFASSTGRQSAVEDDKWKNGAFTKALVEGLSGQADYSKDGLISINELDLYITERVKALTKGRQTSTTTKPATIKDFPIAVTLKK